MATISLFQFLFFYYNAAGLRSDSYSQTPKRIILPPPPISIYKIYEILDMAHCIFIITLGRVDPQQFFTSKTSQIEAIMVTHFFLNISPGSGENWKNPKRVKLSPLVFPGLSMWLINIIHVASYCESQVEQRKYLIIINLLVSK